MKNSILIFSFILFLVFCAYAFITGKATMQAELEREKSFCAQYIPNGTIEQCRKQWIASGDYKKR